MMSETQRKRPLSTDSMDETSESRRKSQKLRVCYVDYPGDFWILVGGQNQESGALLTRVNSALLKIVSPVFKAMLGPMFKEGQSENTRDSPLELPEDDSDATVNMFHLIHYNTQNIDTSEREWLIKLFIACEKYEVLKKFKEFFEVHLRRNEDIESHKIRIKYCVISAQIGHKELFCHFREALVLTHVRKIEEWCEQDVLPLLSDKILADLRKCREAIWSQNQICIARFPREVFKAGVTCTGTRLCVGNWFQILSEHGFLSSAHSASLRLDLLEFLEDQRLGSLGWRLYQARCQELCGDCGDGDKTSRIIRKVIALARSWIHQRKICFECFIDGNIKIEAKCSEHNPEGDDEEDDRAVPSSLLLLA